MSFSIGIVGLPNVGKSTLFKALTKNKVDISNYPFCTIDPNVGIVKVPDERLKKIAEIIKPKKVTPTVIEFVDIAGLVENAHKGEGLGNQFLSHIRKVDAIVHVVRAFEDENVAHIIGERDLERDIKVVNQELILKDLETVEKRLEKTRKVAKGEDKSAQQEQELLESFKKTLESEEPLVSMHRYIDTNDEKQTEGLIEELGLLTAKPVIYVLNMGESDRNFYPAPNSRCRIKVATPQNNKRLLLNLKLESELAELSSEEIKELEMVPPKIGRLIQSCYKLLNLITFYTITGGKETRAWTAKQGTLAPQAGGVVHSDFCQNFIKAEVISSEKLIEVGSWAKAKEWGLIRTEGKEYEVKNGDVIEFKI